MSLTTRIKSGINHCLSVVNLRLDSLTLQRVERARREALAQTGYFDRPAFQVPDAFLHMDCAPVLAAARSYSQKFAEWDNVKPNGIDYAFANDYFRSPDAEVLYSMVRLCQPPRIIEVGSGNSTKIIRQAVDDGGFKAELTSIDPCPRADVIKVADRAFRKPVECLVDAGIFDELQSGDVLFIDSSHIIRAGNDCSAIYLRVIPRLRPGVLIHIHDIFLPYDYPRAWVVERGWDWNEQYLVYCLLMFGDCFSVLWAGHFLQRTSPEFPTIFPRARSGDATSLWLRTTVSDQ